MNYQFLERANHPDLRFPTWVAFRSDRDMVDTAPRSESRMSYEEALLYCTFCNHNGYNDWRLPTVCEYRSNDNILARSWYLTRGGTDKCYVSPVRDV